MIKNIVLSPHLDDEVLGCFSFLSNDTLVIYFGFKETHIDNEWVKKRPSTKTRVQEMERVKDKLGFNYILLDNEVNNYKLNVIIASIENIINQNKPEFILLPNPTYNQDHRVIYEAALIALRPHDINFFVNKVLIYEQIQDMWNFNFREFKPNFFRKINIKDKISTYLIYISQVRDHRSSSKIESLNFLRGSVSNCDYSEAFEILRWVE